MRGVGAILLSVLLAGSVQAAELLPAGHPAGVRQAQERSFTWLYVTGGVLLFAGVGMLISNNSSSGTGLRISNGGDREQVIVAPNSTVSSTGTQ
jgi:hypothetical protein